MSDLETLKEKIIDQMKAVYDPEIPVNIYELGLIYDIRVDDAGVADIQMTLTSPNCPAAASLPQEVQTRAQSVEGIQQANIEIVWEPPWGPEKMTDAARLQLGLM